MTLSDGMDGLDAEFADLQEYYPLINEPSFPTLVDGEAAIPAITPMIDGNPEVCGLTPELEIIHCYVGHGGNEQALNDIKEHAGL